MEKNNITYWEELVNDSPKEYLELLSFEEEYVKSAIKKDSKILEVGCGDGRSLNYLKEITRDLQGIDHDRKAVLDARKNLGEESKIYLSEAEKLPFGEETFDYVLCLMTFSNLAQKKLKILEEMKRVLKKSGKIIVTCYSEKALKTRLEMYKKLNVPIKEINKNGTVIFSESLGDNISEQFSEEELKKIFTDADLKILDITSKGIGQYAVLEKN